MAAGHRYSLSVLDEDVSKVRMVKHYRIRDLDDGGVFISPRQRFTSVVNLVEYYTGSVATYLQDTRLCRLMGLNLDVLFSVLKILWLVLN